MHRGSTVLAGLLLLGLAMPALAQGSPAGQAAGDPGCRPAAQARPATPPAQGRGDGTAPGNAGNTGWSGGTGGSYIGTNPQGSTSASPNRHPETARGLDPIGSPQAPAGRTC
ncbi:hypothetical protein M0638_22350 [Roseomonas sp. NAR14]|uniref:Translation initiation factor IF-2 n=1 Tax=Roseomonas acroporae TaxID=2937791 RepID=A0A9X1YB02_9PROT|nr:hypothetical protein [Roseomonas acroporae]MCK8787119.1 hypothetical protein [Roseomonas acroporae]